MNGRKALNMVWANEAGVSVYVYEGEHDRRVIEIHRINKDGHEEVAATATIEQHNRNRIAQMFEFPNRLEQFRKKYDVSDHDMEELARAGKITRSGTVGESSE